MDQAFVADHEIPTSPLNPPRPLYLADGRLRDWIDKTVTLTLQIGAHHETLTFFVTPLAPENPVILGIPWLRKHNPAVDWTTLDVNFTNCGPRCLPPGAPALAPRAHDPLTNYKPPSVEDSEEDDEQTDPADPAHLRTLRRSRTQRRKRSISTPLKKMGTPPPLQPAVTPAQLPAPARKVGPVRVSPARVSPRRRVRFQIDNGPLAPMDTADIRLLNAANFFLLARQKDVKVMRTTMGELDEATRKAAAAQEPSLLLPELTEGAFKDLLQGQRTPEYWKGTLLERYHDFVDFAFANPVTINRINDDDAAHFFAKLDKAPLTDEEIRTKMPPEYHDLLHVARPQEADNLPPHRSYDHKIELAPGAPLPYSRNRPMSPTELAVIKRWLDDNLSKGNLRPSTSATAAPLLLARKPGGGVRICQDYRGINNITIKNRYPLPLIRETLDAICNAKIYTKLDVIAAFNRVRIAEGHEWKTAFITRFGLYESLVTPFGLCGAPATFQRYINDTLYDILNDYATAYLDDVLIYSSNAKEHSQHVREVLQRLSKAGLQIDLAKCEFGVTRTKYLGLIITPGGIEMDQEKVKAITTWESPTTRRQLQRFLGFANFYRRFIRDFSKLTRCLHDLTKKDNPWKWSDECQLAFETLKSVFSAAPALRVYDWNRATVVEVDASNWSTGGTLLQYGDDDQLYPVAYFSSKHSAQECNYDIYDKELLAVIKALEEWRPELEGTRNVFEIVTDHKNLQTFSTTKQLTPRHMRWSEFLSRFNFRIRYRPGTLNTMPDALSRKPEDVPRDETDDRLRARNRALIDPGKFDHESFHEAETIPDMADFSIDLFALDTSKHIDDLITESYEKSPLLNEITSALENPKRADGWPSQLRERLRIPFNECTTTQDKAYYRGRLIIDPEDLDLQLQLIYRTHASTPTGHPGRTKTLDLMNRRYWWPGLATAVREFCKGCLLCARTKPSRSKPVGFLKPLPLPLSPWRDISVDYITPLPPCTRRGRTYKHVAVVVDRLTKMRHFIATETLEADELMDAFLHRVYSLHGCPETIVSDRGSQFVSAFWRALSARLGITLRPSSAYHPQTNGQTERINAELEKYLRSYISWAQDDWADWLPVAEFAGNNTISETTGVSPFYANYGFDPRIGVEPATPCPPAYSTHQKAEFFKAAEIAERFRNVLDQVSTLSRQAQDRYELNANTKRTDAPKYKAGDQVLLDTRNLTTGRPSEKLAPRWEGPFEILKASSHAVQLNLPANMKVNNTFHVTLIRRWDPGAGIPGQQATEQNVKANQGRQMVRTDGFTEEQQYEFEEILDYGQAENGRWNYLVQWVGHADPTWQPASDLKGCDDDLWKFHEANPHKGKPPAWLKKKKKPATTTTAEGLPTTATGEARPPEPATTTATTPAPPTPPEPRRSTRLRPKRDGP